MDGWWKMQIRILAFLAGGGEMSTVPDEVLILCRERTREVEALDAALARRGKRVMALAPSMITVSCEAGCLRILSPDGELRPGMVVGWCSLHERDYGLVLLRAFARLGIPVFNGHGTLEVGQSKAMNSILLSHVGLPHAKTMICGCQADIRQAIRALGLPLVTKPLVGSGGRGVECLTTGESVLKAFARCQQEHRPIYLQACIEKPGRDLRLQCLDYRPIFGYFRYPPEGTFAANLGLGSRVEPLVDLPPSLLALGEKAARVFDAPMAGIDVVETPDGPVILEVNTVPGYETVLDYAGDQRPVLEPLSRRTTEGLADLLLATCSSNGHGNL